MVDLTVIVLTHNEALHIERCITNALKVASTVVIVDCGSIDGTPQIAERLGAHVLQHPWVNHATQLNWALENAAIHTQWVMRLDADEYMDAALLHSLSKVLDRREPEIAGFEVERYTVFQGTTIRHGGGVSPGVVLRIWRHGSAVCENRWMDEHMLLRGTSARLSGALIDDNLNSLSWWIQKHNGYASREAVELLNLEYGFLRGEVAPNRLQSLVRFKRAVKNRWYARLPVGLRATFYFFYRMVLRLGFLDGTRGIAFHFLQGFWYRTLVDLKVGEVKRHMKATGCDVVSSIRSVLDIDVVSQCRKDSLTRQET